MRGVQEREDEEGSGDESDYSSDENIEQTYCSQLHNNRILKKHCCLKFKTDRVALLITDPPPISFTTSHPPKNIVTLDT